MKVLSKILLILLLVTYSYCNADETPSYKKEASFAETYLEKLRTSDFGYVKKHLDPSVTNLITDEKVAALIQYLPSEEPISTELIGRQIRTFDTQWQGRFTFELQFPESWAVASVSINKVDKKLTVIGINANKMPASQREMNKFTVSGKTPLHYFILALAIVTPLFILFTLVVCIRTPIPKRKWLWVIFILIGTGTVGINWTTGQIFTQPLSIVLFGASALAMSEMAPWIIKASAPFGAIMFWIKRRDFLRQVNG